MTQDTHLHEWLTRMENAAANSTLVKATVNKPTHAAGDLTSVDVRPILVKRVVKLSFTYHHKTRDIVKNYTFAEARGQLAALLPASFTNARLCTLDADWHLQMATVGSTLVKRPPSSTTPPALSHDRAKQRLLADTSKPYLHTLGITDAKGQIYKAAQDKFRQIDKYLEILDGLIKQIPAHGPLRMVDMGAGKGYLTFALYDYLASIGVAAEITGVEYRADLVEKCNAIARDNQFQGLRFVQGSIDSFDCSGAHAVIALHACDTATDDTIAKAIRAGAQLIVVAPCCHKQIRKAMASSGAEHPLNMLLQHGTYTERLAEMITDGMRAQYLELEGYRTNLFEFIADAHTPKNVMIVAVRAANPISEKRRASLAASLNAIKTQFGITHHHLEGLLKI